MRRLSEEQYEQLHVGDAAREPCPHIGAQPPPIPPPFPHPPARFTVGRRAEAWRSLGPRPPFLISVCPVPQHHYTTRLGLRLPNVSALLPQIRANIGCWDQGCWETLTHGGNGQRVDTEVVK